jgi:hypothetical protein
MNGSKKKRGRPRKNGVKELKDFGRVLKVVFAHAKARREGLKRVSAIQEACEFVRQFDPDTRISKTGVKRILAEFVPQDSQIALKVDASVLEGDEAVGRRTRLAQMLKCAGDESGAMRLTGQNLRKPLKSFKFGFEKRPNYPRSNAKSPKP